MFNQYWPDGTIASDALAYIIDDPDVIFQAQADGIVTQTDLGQNTNFTSVVNPTTSGDTTTGNSTMAVSTTTAATGTIAFRIVDFVDSPTSTVGDAFTDLLIKFNEGIHSYTRAAGV